MCRSAVEYPPNGKRCGFGDHFTEAEREARRLKRNARDRELYHQRKANQAAVTGDTEKPVFDVEQELKNMRQTRKEAGIPYEKTDLGTNFDLTKYEEQFSSLTKLSTDDLALGGGEQYFDDRFVSTEESRTIAAKILSEVQPELAYMKIVKEDPNFWANSVNDVKRVYLEDGSVGYFKNYTSATENYNTHVDYGHDVLESFNNEVVAYHLACVMGDEYVSLVPKTVLREYNGHLGTLQAEAAGGQDKKLFFQADDYSPTNLKRAALFDYLAGSQDRHRGNFMKVDGAEEGTAEVVLIDNGFAFPGSQKTAMLNCLRISQSLISEAENREIPLSLEDIDVVEHVKSAIQVDGELYGLLTEGQRSFMSQRIERLLRDGRLSASNYMFKLNY